MCALHHLRYLTFPHPTSPFLFPIPYPYTLPLFASPPLPPSLPPSSFLSLSLSLHFSEPDEALQFINETYLEPYEGTFHDYAEAVVQFGYVNLFSVVSEPHIILPCTAPHCTALLPPLLPSSLAPSLPASIIPSPMCHWHLFSPLLSNCITLRHVPFFRCLFFLRHRATLSSRCRLSETSSNTPALSTTTHFSITISFPVSLCLSPVPLLISRSLCLLPLRSSPFWASLLCWRTCSRYVHLPSPPLFSPPLSTLLYPTHHRCCYR